MNRPSFSDWIAEVRQLMSQYNIQADINMTEARGYFSDGATPEDYFDTCVVFERQEQDFDLRYDL